MVDMNVRDAVEISVAEDLDPAFVQDTLSKPPFVAIDGVFNARELSSDAIRSNYIYRSGSLELITGQGKQDLIKLGVKRIFDIRSAIEFDAYPDPEIDGIELTPALTITDPSLKGQTKYTSLADMYIDMLDSHKNVWVDVFEHIRDRPGEPLLIHCTAGKDRTATIAALIHGIAGTSTKSIAHDYALTRVGIEPVKSVLTAKMTGGKPLDLTNPVMRMVSDMSPGLMLSFLKLLDDKYGSIESYLQHHLEFTTDEIEQIRQNLRR